MSDKCVCCDGDLPAEGYGGICEACKKVAEELDAVEAVKKRIGFVYGDNPGIHIKNSYLVTRNEDIKSVLEYIRGLDGYKKLKENGYTRTPQSEFREWKGHNILYKLGYKRQYTGSVDIDQKEPMWRRFVYAILSIF